MIEWRISTLDLQRTVLALQATDEQARAALKSTLGKMAAWLRTRSIKGLSAELKMAQKIIRRRLKAFKVKAAGDGSSVTVWYGLDPVALIYLGAKEGGGGVKAAAGRFRQSAFIAKGKGGGKQVFKRTGKGRLPIAKQVEGVQAPADDYLDTKLISSAAFEIQFFKTFEHELSWRMQTLK